MYVQRYGTFSEIITDFTGVVWIFLYPVLKISAVHLGVVVIIQLCIVNKLTTCYTHTQTISSLHWWQFVMFRL